MRETKFRAWIEGSYIDGEKHMLEWHDMALLTFMGVTQDPRLTLMQFTGLTDKNGKEIYEGDILRFKKSLSKNYKGKKKYDYHEVFWDEKKLTYKIRSQGYENTLWSVVLTHEVIGNIYEHPELLNP